MFKRGQCPIWCSYIASFILLSKWICDRSYFPISSFTLLPFGCAKHFSLLLKYLNCCWILRVYVPVCCFYFVALMLLSKYILTVKYGHCSNTILIRMYFMISQIVYYIVRWLFCSHWWSYHSFLPWMFIQNGHEWLIFNARYGVPDK